MWRAACVVAAGAGVAACGAVAAGAAGCGAAAAGGVLGLGAVAGWAKPAATGMLNAAAIAVAVTRCFKLMMSLPMLGRTMRYKTSGETKQTTILFQSFRINYFSWSL